jgi:hypothetical protein
MIKKSKINLTTKLILKQTEEVVGELLKIQAKIATLKSKKERDGLNEMLTESLIEFIDFDYIEKMPKTKK